MVFLKQIKQKNGRVNISFVHGFRDPVTKKVMHKTIEKLGFLDEYAYYGQTDQQFRSKLTSSSDPN